MKAIDAPEPQQPVDLMDLLDGYVNQLERQGKGKEARKRWTPVFTDLMKFVGHNDALRITDDNIRNWRNKKLETLAAKTVSDVYMASVRAVLNWAVEEKKIPENPTKGVKVKSRNKRSLVKRAFAMMKL
ncbi:hypothetical protein HED51_03080 [Ochrobactrum grignonense]|nr:hypothetical protein [Brucella grignonensis]